LSLPFYPALFLLAALWGGSFLFMRVASPVLGPVWLIALRVLIAGLVVLPLLAGQGRFAEFRDNWRALFLVGCLNAGLPFTLMAYATLELTAGMTSILNATVPIFAALVAGLVYDEALDRRRAAGVALGFAGVVVLVGLPQNGGPLPLLPVVAGLAAALLYVFGANQAKRRLASVSAATFVSGTQLGAALMLAPFLPLFPPHAAPDGLTIAALLALAVLSTALAFLIYFRLIHEAGPTRTLSVTYLIPLFAILWGALLLDESVTSAMAAGGGLVLLGVALANTGRPAAVSVAAAGSRSDA
jgi:drug/metabolite transporter (DMT)-like permease